MRKSHLPLAALGSALALGVATPASAAILGSDAAACASGKPALIVRVSGFKQGSGTLKLSLYGNNPSVYLKKQGRLRRVKLPVNGKGPMDVCIAVPRPGRYTVAVHHDLNGNGDKDRQDGGGYSNNPRVTIANLRPAFSRTSVPVGNGPARINVRLLYVRGLTVGPASA